MNLAQLLQQAQDIDTTAEVATPEGFTVVQDGSNGLYEFAHETLDLHVWGPFSMPNNAWAFGPKRDNIPSALARGIERAIKFGVAVAQADAFIVDGE